jgi:hypothetical protein
MIYFFRLGLTGRNRKNLFLNSLEPKNIGIAGTGTPVRFHTKRDLLIKAA